MNAAHSGMCGECLGRCTFTAAHTMDEFDLRTDVTACVVISFDGSTRRLYCYTVY